MSRLIQGLKVLIFIIIGGGILWLMYRSQQSAYCDVPDSDLDCSLLDKLLADFASIDWKWILIILVIYMISNVARTLRWKQILAADGYTPQFVNTLGSIMVGYFVNLGIPRAGEIARTALLTRYESVPLEKSLASVVVDRVADIVSLLIILALAFLFAGGDLYQYVTEYADPSILRKLMYVAFIGAIIGVICIYIIRRLIKQGSEHWIIQKANSFLESLVSVSKLDNVWLFVLYTVVIWICYYFMTYLCFFAFEPTSHLSAKVGFIIFVLGTLGIVFPSPGGMGSYQFLVMNGLMLYGIESADAFSFSNIVFFAIQLFCNLLLGIFFFILLPLYNMKSNEA